VEHEAGPAYRERAEVNLAEIPQLRSRRGGLRRSRVAGLAQSLPWRPAVQRAGRGPRDARNRMARAGDSRYGRASTALSARGLAG
jgi:hypothetical protein